MPADVGLYLTPTDFKLLRQARRRGGEAAAARIAAAIANRVGPTMAAREAVRRALMADDQDHTWPPAFLSRES